MNGNVLKATLILAAFLLAIIIFTLPKTETSEKTAGAEQEPASAGAYFSELEQRQFANLSEENKSAEFFPYKKNKKIRLLPVTERALVLGGEVLQEKLFKQHHPSGCFEI